MHLVCILRFYRGENLNILRVYLKKNKCSASEHLSTGKVGHPPIQEAGSVRNIYKWLNKNGEVIEEKT